jgi:hypothetical protein
MFVHIVMQLSGKMASLFTQAWALLMACLWSPVKRLPAKFTRLFQNARNLYLMNLLCAQTVSNFSRLLVSLITVAQLIKAGLITAKQVLTQIGLQLAITVRQILQRAVTAIKKTNVLVALMKLVVLHINASKTALTLTVRQWIQAGLKLLETVRQRLLVAYLSQRLERVRVTLINWVLLVTKKLAAALTLMGNQLKAIGLKLQGSVHLHLQPVLRLQSLNKKLVEKTKLVQSLLKKVVAVLIRMGNLLKVIGLKQAGTAPQPQQPAQRRRSKGH